MKSQTASDRPVTVEQLESRLCLSSPIGGDFEHHHRGTLAFRGERPMHVTRENAPLRTPLKAARVAAAAAMADRFDGAGPDAGASARTRAGKPLAKLPTVHVRIVVKLTPWLAPRVGYSRPIDEMPPVSDPTVEPAPQPSRGGSAVAQSNQPPAPAPAHALADAHVNVELPEMPADKSDAGELVAETYAIAAGTGPVLATATVPSVQSVATTTSAVIDRLTSTWHDGSTAVAAADVASAIVAEWVPVETVVAGAVDAATHLLAPVLDAAASVASAIDHVAPMTAAAARVAAYEIAHMGSPFALLADSVASFVEESATVSSAIAQSEKRGPWLLTAGVIAADVIILTYVYRRKSTRRRAQLAPPGVA